MREGAGVQRISLGGALVAVTLLVALAPPADAARRKVPRLQAFSSCTALVDYARTNAERFGGGTGVPGRVETLAPQGLASPSPKQAPTANGGPQPVAAAPVAATAGRESDTAFSQTNNQESGVDEPDIVKTDGKRLIAVANGQLLVIDVTGATPVLRGRLPLEGSAQQILLRGDTVLVMAGVSPVIDEPAQGGGPTPTTAAPRQVPTPAPAIYPGNYRTQTRLTEISIADPAKPTLRRELTLDGALVDARLTDGTARVVITSPPKPVAADDVADAGLRTWVPKTVLRSRVSGHTFTRGVVPCDDVRRPQAFSGLDLLSVLTIDLDRGLYSVDRDAILAGAQTVYASRDSLYVASRSYSRAVEAGTGIPDGVRTQIHRYDARGTQGTTYQATGEVPGFVLNQYAMSEDRGVLRVATTGEPLWFPDGTSVEAESRVTVLKETAGRLNPIGSVGGLGKGERIYAVRFLGDRGYVVTFKQTDPLYTLDLSDPTAPRVRAELKLLGYSAYLHPIGEDRLLGVGQDATPEGRRTGAQVSLFDVSDPAAPKRVAQASLGAQTSTTAEFDPHAFLYWAPTRLGVIPLQRYGNGGDDPGFTGAVGLRVGRDDLSEVGRVAHPAKESYASAPIGRSLVVGDRLYTLSYDGLQTANLADLVPVGFLPFN